MENTIEVEAGNEITVEVFLTRPAKSFNKIAVAGEEDVETITANETLTFVAGSGITITTDDATNTLTFEAAGFSTIDGGTDDD